MEAADLISSFRQQVRGDQLLGLRFLPLAPEFLDRIQNISEQAIEPPATTPVRAKTTSRSVDDADSRRNRLATLDAEVKACRRCSLCQTRKQTVFGQGNPFARLVFVGEGPGYEEDQQGLAFIGAAGQLLTKMIVAMGLTRDEVFICNVVKCRPPGNRTPTPDEIQACNPFLRQQLGIINPEVIVALGAPATQTLLNTGLPIGRLRGRFHDYFVDGMEGAPAVPIMPTYHPAYLLRTPGDKAKTWDDLQQVMIRLGLPVPKKA